MYNPFAMQAFGETYADPWWAPEPELEPYEEDYGDYMFWSMSEWWDEINAIWDAEEEEFGTELDYLPKHCTSWAWGA